MFFLHLTTPGGHTRQGSDFLTVSSKTSAHSSRAKKDAVLMYNLVLTTGDFGDIIHFSVIKGIDGKSNFAVVSAEREVSV